MNSIPNMILRLVLDFFKAGYCNPRHSRGFSLVQVMVAAGMASGLAITLTKLSQDQNKIQKTIEANTHINHTVGLVQNVLLDKNHCSVNFSTGSSPALFSSDQLYFYDPVTKARGASFFGKDKNSVYQRNGFTVASMSLIYTSPSNFGELEIVFDKAKDKALGGTSTKRSIALQFQLDTSGNLISCFSDISKAVHDSIKDGVEKACVAVGMKYDGSNPADPKCVIDSTNNAPKTIITCGTGEFLKMAELTYNSTTKKFEYKPDCKKASPCNDKQIGLVVEKKIDCFDCPSGLGFIQNDKLVCKDLTCSQSPDIQYMAGIDSSGNPMCRKLVDSTKNTCGVDGFKLVATSNGSVAVECCESCSIKKYADITAGICKGSYKNGAATTNCGVKCEGTSNPINWYIGSWSVCSNQIKTRTVRCDNSAYVDTAGGACCIGSKEKEEEPCTCNWKTSGSCGNKTFFLSYVCDDPNGNESCCTAASSKPAPYTCPGALYGAQHWESDCKGNAGYEVYTKDGHKFCRRSGGDCAQNWSIYNRSTTKRRCYGSSDSLCDDPTCETLEHGFSTEGQHTCTHPRYADYDTWGRCGGITGCDESYKHEGCIWDSDEQSTCYANWSESLCY